jgi:hypothetical protein
VGQVQIHLALPVDSVAVQADLEDLAGRDVSRDEVAVRGVLLLEKVPALFLGDR